LIILTLQYNTAMTSAKAMGTKAVTVATRRAAASISFVACVSNPSIKVFGRRKLGIRLILVV
jgi:hypothetical protein